MTSKKYQVLLAAGMFLATGAMAQVTVTSTSGYDVYDSTVISNKNMGQQNEFWNHNYNFPAKPRNMWEIGIKGGMPTVSGDVSAKIPTFGFGAHIRKALGYVFSLRLEYINGNAKGLNWKAAENFGKNPAWNQYASIQRTNAGPIVPRYGWGGAVANGADLVYYNYKANIQDLSLQGLVSLNNIRFHKNKTGMQLYGGAGIGATMYNTKINALDANGNSYAALFRNVFNSHDPVYKNRKDIIKQLKDGMDDTYETAAESEAKNRRPGQGDKTLRASGTVLAGVAFKLGRRINLAIEDRHTFIKDDLLDGQRWQEHAIGDPVLTRDFDSYNFASLGLNFNLGANAVEPLYWLNPLDYAYGELNNPRHMLLPKPVLDDTDGDGVIDQLDREPNTPAGCPVDTHGVSLDTDGDGVPDCRDKQLITPTECQPVDADGVGKCPEPECCKGTTVVPGGCPASYPSVSFSNGSSSLSADTRAILANVASTMKANPNCNITITGYPEASKASQANCQRRVDAVKKYLVESQNISSSRISTDCVIDGGAVNTIDIKGN